ncbi:MAG: DEAD/DEAH box helicase family protein [bacterium]|nr:DEAD/DEAH box helicase family protein [bacterium]
MIELKDYQEKAIEKLKDEVNELLESDDNKICVFKSPTGSGKTLMMAEALKRLVRLREDNKKLSFIWISVNKLHDQSKDSLERYYEDTRIIKCSNFEDLQDKTIDENEILFFNWQSINKSDNIYIRENEQDNNLSNIITNTKDEGREIILIIDESHHTAKAEKSKEVIDAINPKVTIEVSATPQIKDLSRIVEVDFKKVQEEGMIKKEVTINPEIDKIKVSGKSTDDIVIDSALKKRKELKKLYEKEGTDINPLVLIQLPDNKAGVLDRKEDIIETLKKRGITTDNRKLAIYLSDKDNKINLENISKPDNEVEVLLFKQAIALGWDCPRAQILILFRDWKSIEFSIQTIGRIMRMPEFYHYDEDELNRGFVFTNLSDVKIAEDIAKDYITIHEAKRREDYKEIKLNSNFLKRQREKTRLSGEFSKIFLDVAKKDKLKEKINKNPSESINSLMIDGRIVNLDKIQLVQSKNHLEIKKTAKELQYQFDLFLRSSCTPYAPVDSSRVIRTTLYRFFDKEIGMNDYTEIQKIILGTENNQFFIDTINKSKEIYDEEVVKKLKEERESEDYVWEVPESVMYNSLAKEIDYKKSIMKPHFTKAESKPEKDFIGFLEKSDNDVIWWYKNGEGEKKYFSVKYRDGKKVPRGFYVDFIVLTKDGKVGLFDTKAGRTAEDSKQKAEALQRYIKEQNEKHNKKLWGGIVVPKNDSFRYNAQEKYQFNETNLGEDWDFLSFS